MVSHILHEGWTVFTADGTQPEIPAPVPGTVHDALLAAGVLRDLHWRFNENTQQWVCEKDWIYRCAFDCSEELFHQKNLRLCCDGLDTFATVFLNGREVGRADNMFRYWSWDVRPYIRRGANQLEIHFSSVLPVARAGTARCHLPAWNEPEPGRHWGITGRGYLRKQACQAGWDWGEMAVTAGVYKAVRLEGWSAMRISDWRHVQKHEEGSVEIRVEVELEGDGSGELEVELTRAGVLAGSASAAITSLDGPARCVQLNFSVRNPELWWPAGMGPQPLYDLAIRWRGEGEADERRVRIGLRKMELVREPDAWGRSFHFACNGRPFFAKGANFIPLDQHPTSQNVIPRYRDLLESTVAAHMNMLRVWGGGYFLHDGFYDLCDELGICVWQDLMFLCGSYPFNDPEFQASVAAETADNARALRHHACLTVWCGNNELEQGFCTDEDRPLRIPWEDYLPFFEELLPSALRREDPVTPYVPGSPHSAPEERKDYASQRSGDYHLWEIWFSESFFEAYRNYRNRFLSEFGFQSLPSMETLRLMGGEADLNINSPVMEFHQRSGPGMRRIFGHMLEYFRVPPDLERQALLSQFVHGLGLKEGIEFWRSLWPQCGGATYWQLNDVWPAPTWSSIDVTGRWKAVHHMARRFFAPVLVTGAMDRNRSRCDLAAVNDLAGPIAGTVEALLTNGGGEELARWEFEVKVPANSAVAITSLDLANWVNPNLPTDAILWLTFSCGAAELASNVVFTDRPKFLNLRDPQPAIAVGERLPDGSREIRVEVAAPSLWSQLIIGNATPGVRPFDDQFLHIRPGRPATFRLRPGACPGDVQARVRSLYDLLPSFSDVMA